MSFILQDEELIKLLTAAGASHVNKYGQVAQDPTIEDNLDYQLAKKLLIGLQRQIDPDNAPARSVIGQEGAPEGTDIRISAKQLKNLGDLLTWVATNKITQNGNRFAWTDAEKNAGAVLPQEILQYDVMGEGRQRDPATRQPLTSVMWASKPELISFISSLRDSPEFKKNKVFQVMISKLITQANEGLEDNEQISATQHGKGSDVAGANIVVDGFPSDILDLRNPYEGLDQRPNFEQLTNHLTMANLRDGNSLLSWLNAMKLQAPNGTIGVLDHRQPDPCTAVHVLYLRATRLAQIGGGPNAPANYPQIIQAYRQAVVTIGKTFTGADGKPCAVTAPGTSAETEVRPAGRPGGSQISTQQLMSVVSSMPLTLEAVHLDSIQRFFQNYMRILQNTSTTQYSVVSGIYSRVQDDINKINQTLKTPMTSFTLEMSPRDILTWVKEPAAYTSFLTPLYEVVELTSDAILNFYNHYARDQRGQDLLGGDQMDMITQQILGPSIARDNKHQLSYLINDAPNVIGFKR